MFGCLWLRKGSDSRQYPHHSLASTLRVIEFPFDRVGILKSAEKIAQADRLVDDIEHKWKKH
jgi:hypothetical protein